MSIGNCDLLGWLRASELVIVHDQDAHRPSIGGLAASDSFQLLLCLRVNTFQCQTVGEYSRLSLYGRYYNGFCRISHSSGSVVISSVQAVFRTLTASYRQNLLGKYPVIAGV
jgi:hypothetical protein